MIFIAILWAGLSLFLALALFKTEKKLTIAKEKLDASHAFIKEIELSNLNSEVFRCIYNNENLSFHKTFSDGFYWYHLGLKGWSIEKCSKYGWVWQSPDKKIVGEIIVDGLLISFARTLKEND
jgi:hypothetical protein